MKKNFLPYKEAHKFAQSLGIKTRDKWKKYCDSSEKPANIPDWPDTFYKKEWISWNYFFKADNDFLKKIKKEKKEERKNKTNLIKELAEKEKIKFLSFKEAHNFALSLKLKNAKEWREYCKSDKKPKNIPDEPLKFYKPRFSWHEWLGNILPARPNRNFLPYEQAQIYVSNIGLKNAKEWREFCNSGKKPKNIPSCPSGKYKNKGWTSMNDWLGSSCNKIVFLSYKRGKRFVKKIKLNSFKEWKEYCKSGKKPKNIPSTPDSVYRGSKYKGKNKEWVSWNDWLGTNKISISHERKIYGTNFLSYEEASKYIQQFNLANHKEWREFCKSGKRPLNIPFSPDHTYKHKGWISWMDWLGTTRKIIIFEELKKIAQEKGIKTQKEYHEFRKKYKTATI